MLLGEPEPTQADLNFSLLGIPVRVHPFFWLIGIFIGPFRSGLKELLVWLVAFFIGILCHEMGHALVIRGFGAPPWITLYGLGGMASYNQAQTRWRGSSTLGQIAISAAGPGAGFLLAAAVIGLLILAGKDVILIWGAPYGLMALPSGMFPNEYLAWFVQALLFVTIVYGIFNLLPIYPLDGGKIAREMLLAASPRTGITASLMVSAAAAAVLAVYFLTLREWFVVILFAYLAFANYSTLQAYRGRGPW